MITMFIVLSGENWNHVMNITVEKFPDEKVLACSFFVSAVLIGNFMLLNLFLAILLKFLEDVVVAEEELKRKEKEKKQHEQLMKDKKEAQRIDQLRDEKFQERLHGHLHPDATPDQQPKQSSEGEGDGAIVPIDRELDRKE
mgnify:CR=1 FL=1